MSRFTKVAGEMFKQEGPKAFYKGITPRVLRVAPGQAIVFTVSVKMAHSGGSRARCTSVSRSLSMIVKLRRLMLTTTSSNLGCRVFCNVVLSMISCRNVTPATLSFPSSISAITAIKCHTEHETRKSSPPNPPPSVIHGVTIKKLLPPRCRAAAPVEINSQRITLSTARNFVSTSTCSAKSGS